MPAINHNNNLNKDNNRSASAISKRLRELKVAKRPVFKKDRLAHQQKLIREPNVKQTFLKKKEQLEASFTKVHTELAIESRNAAQNGNSNNATPPGYNVFMEILKVKQVIDLEDEEQHSQKQLASSQVEDEDGDKSKETNGEEDQEATTSANAIVGRTLKKECTQREEEEANDIVVIAVNKSTSNNIDLDLREDRNRADAKRVAARLDRQRQRAEHAVKMKLEARPSCSSDMDLRVGQQVEAMEIEQQEEIPVPEQPSSSNGQKASQVQSSSSAVAAKPQASKEDIFISQVRFASRAVPIDLTPRYELHGLRYFQDIPTKDLYEPGESPAAYSRQNLSVVSFNILCQRSKEKTPFLYGHLRRQPQLGSWEYRKDKLFVEFDRLSADVFCLQEVQDIHYEADILPYFKSRGYSSLFTPRAGPDMPDGCATFWRTDRLELVRSKPVYYNLGVEGMHKDNVGQVMAFVLVGTGSVVCISNTHIYYNMKRGEVKLSQMAFLLGSMHEMESQIRAHNFCVSDQQRSVIGWNLHFAGHILCGDFNMEPSSPLHRFLLEQRVNLRTSCFSMARRLSQKTEYARLLSTASGRGMPLRLPIRTMLISDNCIFVEKNDTVDLLDLSKGELSHPFTFASVYEHWNLLGEPEVSSYSSQDAGNPDFIFYSVAEQRELMIDRPNSPQENLLLNAVDRELAHESFIRLKKRLSMPTRAQLDRACGPLPNAETGSDHLALWCLFEILVAPINTQQRQP